MQTVLMNCQAYNFDLDQNNLTKVQGSPVYYGGRTLHCTQESGVRNEKTIVFTYYYLPFSILLPFLRFSSLSFSFGQFLSKSFRIKYFCPCLAIRTNTPTSASTPTPTPTATSRT